VREIKRAIKAQYYSIRFNSNRYYSNHYYSIRYYNLTLACGYYFVATKLYEISFSYSFFSLNGASFLFAETAENHQVETRGEAEWRRCIYMKSFFNENIPNKRQFAKRKPI